MMLECGDNMSKEVQEVIAEEGDQLSALQMTVLEFLATNAALYEYSLNPQSENGEDSKLESAIGEADAELRAILENSDTGVLINLIGSLLIHISHQPSPIHSLLTLLENDALEA